MLYIKDINGNFIGKDDRVLFCMNNKLHIGYLYKICLQKVAIKYMFANRYERKAYVDHNKVVKAEV